MWLLKRLRFNMALLQSQKGAHHFSASRELAPSQMCATLTNGCVFVFERECVYM